MYFGYLQALLLTFGIEGIAILILFRRIKYVYYSLLCNLLTNPAINLLLAVSYKLFGEGAYYLTLVIVELTAVFIEAVVYNYICEFGIKKAVMLSVLLNGLSFSTGILIVGLTQEITALNRR